MDRLSSSVPRLDPKTVAAGFNRVVEDSEFGRRLTDYVKALICRTPSTVKELEAIAKDKWLNDLSDSDFIAAMSFILVRCLARSLRVGDLETVKHCLARGAVLKEAYNLHDALEAHGPRTECGKFLRSGDKNLLAAMFYRAVKYPRDVESIPPAMSEDLNKIQKETAASSS